jgi:hypothetical protein
VGLGDKVAEKWKFEYVACGATLMKPFACFLPLSKRILIHETAAIPDIPGELGLLSIKRRRLVRNTRANGSLT